MNEYFFTKEERGDFLQKCIDTFKMQIIQAEVIAAYLEDYKEDSIMNTNISIMRSENSNNLKLQKELLTAALDIKKKYDRE